MIEYPYVLLEAFFFNKLVLLYFHEVHHIINIVTPEKT